MGSACYEACSCKPRSGGTPVGPGSKPAAPPEAPTSSAPSRSGSGLAVDTLTPRELEVLVLVARGLTTPEIAAELVISRRTVHAHLRSIYPKLGVTSRVGATRYAILHGVI